MDNLALPLILKDGYLPRTDLERSIVYSIGLVLGTRVDQLPFLPQFGCRLWDREYSDLETSNKADIKASVRNAIDAFEKRLYNVTVSFDRVADGATRPLGLIVKVTGNYMDEGEEKRMESSFKVG